MLLKGMIFSNTSTMKSLVRITINFNSVGRAYLYLNETYRRTVFFVADRVSTFLIGAYTFVSVCNNSRIIRHCQAYIDMKLIRNNITTLACYPAFLRAPSLPPSLPPTLPPSLPSSAPPSIPPSLSRVGELINYLGSS